MFVTAVAAHETPDRPPLLVAVGDRVVVGTRSEQWPAFVFVTCAAGEGWVPARHLSSDADEATVEVAYDTTELPVSAGQTVELLERDDISGWWWCRDENGGEGWVPVAVFAGN